MESATISVISLVIAALAVIVGPMVSLKINTTQSKIQRKQIISPIRQAWINELRHIMVELSAKSAHYWAAGFEERKDKEYYRITELEHQLRLYLNSNEKDHQMLLLKAKEMVALINGKDDNYGQKFWETHSDVIKISQQILKREWERVKTDI